MIFVHNHRTEVYSFSPLNMMIAIVFLIGVLYQIEAALYS